MRNNVRAGIVIGLVAGAGFATAGEVRAQTATTVDFVVVSGTPITPTGTTDPGDILVVTGRSAGTTTVGTCAPAGAYPVQDGVVIDPGAAQRATRVIGFIVVSQTLPLAPGIRLGSLTNLPGCQNGTVGYDRYRGTVQ